MYAGRDVTSPAHHRKGFQAALDELAQLDKSDIDRALRRIVSTDAAALPVDRVSYWELTPARDAIHCRILYEHEKQAFSEGAELRAVDYPSYFGAMLNDRLIVAHDACTDPRTKEFVHTYFRAHDIRSMLDVPVWRRGILTGVVCHEHVGSPRTWTPEEQDFALAVGNMVSNALEAHGRRRAEEGYALIARATNDVVWDWDIQGDVIEWPDAMFSVFRYRPTDVSPTVAWWAERLHPGDRERVKATLQDAMSAGSHDLVGSVSMDSWRRLRRDGGRSRLHRAQRPRPADSHGRQHARHHRARRNGGTDRAQRPDGIRRCARRRCCTRHQQPADVRQRKPDPRTRCATQRRTSIASSCESSWSKRRKALSGFDGSSATSKSFSRPREDEIEEIDLATVTDSSISMAWNEIRHRAQLLKDYRDAPRVRMNRARLGQVILNLLVNAAHAIVEGNVERNRIEIRVGASPDGDALLEIRDTGTGIPPDVLGRVFEPFFTTKSVGVGTGLGLAICHSIVTAAGGRIVLASPASGGCIVRITLPPVVVATPRGSCPEHRASSASHLARRR